MTIHTHLFSTFSQYLATIIRDTYCRSFLEVT